MNVILLILTIYKLLIERNDTHGRYFLILEQYFELILNTILMDDFRAKFLQKSMDYIVHDIPEIGIMDYIVHDIPEIGIIF